MGQALYRKYRSGSFDEVVGQSHITATLKNAIDAGKISHAYLFTGPRGTGKTSVARIFAHAINDIDYDKEVTHLDIVEIDAASNRRIDEIRELREKAHIAPTSARFKVYIIDEVHMLTKEAFNALLKTLEEPPAHVVFVLATTEAHKLPDTIISRTQRFTFKSITPQDTVSHLRHIANKEDFDISDDALALIAEHAGGSFRDAISILDQLRGTTTERIERAHTELLLGLAPNQAITEIYDSLTKTPKHIVEALETALQFGAQPAMLAKQLAHLLRTHLLGNTLPNELVDSYDELMQSLLLAQGNQSSAVQLEVALLKPSLQKLTHEIGPPAKQRKISKPEPDVAPQHVAKVNQPEQAQTHPDDEPKAPDPTPQQAETLGSVLPEPLEEWQKVLGAIKSNHNTLYSFLRMARPEFSGETLTLYCKFPFHQKRLSDVKNVAIITEHLHKIAGKQYQVVAQSETADNVVPHKVQPPSTSLATISNIFGGGEVLES
jgi:DNA polymerase III subunit gamma/tau